MPIELIQRTSPVLVTLPHTGANMPHQYIERLRDPSDFATAPDLGLDHLLHGLVEDFSILRANFHRYLSDVDAVPPSGGMTLTEKAIGVVPLVDHRGATIWARPPTPREAASWRAMYFAPYHAALATQIARARAQHGFAVVVNCRARPVLPDVAEIMPRPEVLLSTFMNTSCAVDLSTDIFNYLKNNGADYPSPSRKNASGWTIRHYGRPKTFVHALDLNLDEARYIAIDHDTPFYDATVAESMRTSLSGLMRLIADWKPMNLT